MKVFCWIVGIFTFFPALGQIIGDKKFDPLSLFLIIIAITCFSYIFTHKGCPHCGKQMRNDVKVCSHCGRSRDLTTPN